MTCLCFLQQGDAQVEYAPWGRHEWLSRPGLTDAKQVLFVRVDMPPGKGHQFHYHPTREEIIYILDGRAEQWVGRESRLLGPGESAHIPMNTVHGIYNTSREPVKFLAILSPAESPGPFLIDCYKDDPWSMLKKPFEYTKE
jgi:quercetin dioxygenase-like cupin family protein